MDASVIAEAQFEILDEADWRARAEKALHGADFTETLVTQAEDGFRFGPVHARRTSCGVMLRQTADKPWIRSQRIDDPDAGRAAAQAGEDAANGADELVLCLAGSPAAYGFGLPVPAKQAFSAILAATAENAPSIRFQGSAMTARALADHIETEGGGRHVHFGLDPVSSAAMTTRDFTLDHRLADFAGPLGEYGFAATVMQADGRIAHNAGASEAQELAFVLASLTALLRACESGGMQLESVFSATSLGVAADQRQLLSIAKLRALRLLHARLQAACGIDEPAPALIHAETSFRMLARLDPETNILRNTIAAFAAGVGGADSVAVLPHTMALGLPDGFARRVARNTQTILIHESHLDHVGDPSAGSGGIEALTDALAEAAWSEFQAIESEGGIMASLAVGGLQSRIAAMVKKRSEAIRSAAMPIVGTSLFPAETERPVNLLEERVEETERPRGSRRALVPVPLYAALEGEAA